MKAINILFISCLLVSCSSQFSQTDREEMKLKGAVKSVLTVEYKAVDKFGEGEISRGEPRYYGTDYVLFDSLGNYLEQLSYAFDKIKKDTKYIYDNNGKTIYWVSYNDKGDIRYGYDIKYDDKGNPIEYIDLEDDKIIRGDAKYDDNGNLIYKKDQYGYKSYYEYVDNKLIEDREESPYGSKWRNVYTYDNEGKLIERKLLDSENTVWQYSYDNNNRETMIKRLGQKNNNADYKLEALFKKYYSSDLTTNPYIWEEWDEDGILKGRSYYYWPHDDTDTLSMIELDKDYKITKIYNYTKTSSQKESLSYEIDSRILTQTKYNVVNGIILSSVDDDGYETSYEYDKGNLVKKTYIYSDGKNIDLYDKGRITNHTTYDKHNKEVFKSEYKYSGNNNNGKTLVSTKDKEGKTSTIEYIIENGKIMKLIQTQNGITSTIINKYNDIGDIIESIEGSDKKTYTYIYDQYNNWISKNEFVNDKIESITERAIMYY